MSTLLINASPNTDGNSVALAQALLGDSSYEQLNLCDYVIGGYGQQVAGDQFDEVLARLKAADTVVVTSPVYWHNLTGHLRNFLDRCYGPVQAGDLSGKRMFFCFQGGAPKKWMLEAGDYTMSRYAGLYGMEYMGMATTAAEARKLGAKL